MNILVIGLGSMGSRRIRNLKCLGYNSIVGYDKNQNRSKSVGKEYGISIENEISADVIKKRKIDIFIISTSPESHLIYAKLAIQTECHAFIEASVVDPSGIRDLAIQAKEKNLKVVPSCTMLFYDFVKTLKNEIVDLNTIGKVFSFNYHTGQYLEDWHPWESIGDYYVSKKETGGCREIVPFEMTWLSKVFGLPLIQYSFKKKTGKLVCDIDDLYFFHGKFGNKIDGFVIVDVLSRPTATRRLQVIGDKGKIQLDGLQRLEIEVYGKVPRSILIDSRPTHPGYINPESPYVEEIKTFLDYVNGKVQTFPNNLEDDATILDILNTIDKMAG